MFVFKKMYYTPNEWKQFDFLIEKFILKEGVWSVDNESEVMIYEFLSFKDFVVCKKFQYEKYGKSYFEVVHSKGVLVGFEYDFEKDLGSIKVSLK